MCSMQKISQVHSCIWKLEFHADFLPQPLEIIKIVLNFLEFKSVCKKSAQFIHSFIHSPYDQCLTTISDHTHPNIFLSTLNFWYQHVKKYGLFHQWLLNRSEKKGKVPCTSNPSLSFYHFQETNHKIFVSVVI